jgi:hypothetical protein
MDYILSEAKSPFVLSLFLKNHRFPDQEKDPALLFRFTERDLRKEDRDEHRVTRYADRGGIWVPGAT